MNIFFYKKKVIVLVLALFGISSLFLFQNCSEIKPLTSEGEFIPDPGDQGDGTGDNNGDGGDSGDTGGGNTSGTYDNSDPYKCDYNDDGVVDFETRTNGMANTSRPAGMELIQPINFSMNLRTWESQWTGFAWPRETGQLATIGSWSAKVTGAWSGKTNSYTRNTPAAGMYITMPFRVTDEHVRNYDIKWKEAQPMSGFYTFSRRTDEITVTISPCAGDLRPKNRNSQDLYLKYCRTNEMTGTSGSLAFTVYPQGGQMPSPPSASNCALEAGKTYWVTVSMAHSSAPDFITGTRNGCADVDQDGHAEIEQCEANFSLRWQ